MSALVYAVWIASVFANFYTIEVATERWGFPGRLGAFCILAAGGMSMGLGMPLLLHQMGVDKQRIWLPGVVAGIVFNAVFVAIGVLLSRAKTRAGRAG